MFKLKNSKFEKRSNLRIIKILKLFKFKICSNMKFKF
jgi:hypothetical protein